MRYKLLKDYSMICTKLYLATNRCVTNVQTICLGRRKFLNKLFIILCDEYQRWFHL